MTVDLFSLLQQRSTESWLLTARHHLLLAKTQALLTDLAQWEQSPKVLLATSDPIEFLAGFIATVTLGYPLFLGNPDWVEQEWKQVLAHIQPNVILGQSLPTFPLDTHSHLTQGLIMIPTGGSSGKIKFAVHTWETIQASVSGFRQYFQVDSIDSYCVLPLYHVSGLLQFIRSFTTNGKLVIQSSKQPEFISDSGYNWSSFFISLVPTLLQRWLDSPAISTHLTQFKTILLGGAPAWESLLEKARSLQLNVALTYGMTETAAQVVTLKSEDFLQGNSTSGQVLPHAQVKIYDEQGVILPPNQLGNIHIQAQSLMLGYYCPGFALSQPLDFFATDDLGYFDTTGYLQLVGRKSQKIITGGENVYPAEVEAAILSTQLVTDVCAIALPDLEWGQVIIAIYVPRFPDVLPLETTGKIKEALLEQLSAYKRPKHWVALPYLPRNAQGKINLESLQQIAASQLASISKDYS